ncbi:hypothetical protein JW711_02690 [Candidatus Woesearchaeota archaeon]|nr:hypothetical protein [Candidatus Woesearchaeota archaeon]
MTQAFTRVFDLTDLITSPEDFKDPRARQIFQDNNLDLSMICPAFRELLYDGIIQEHRVKLNINLTDSKTPLNVFSSYHEKLAYAAVAAYELTRRPSLRLQFMTDQLALDSNAYYLEKLGRSCEYVMQRLREDQVQYIKRIIRESEEKNE